MDLPASLDTGLLRSIVGEGGACEMWSLGLCEGVKLGGVGE